MARILKNQSGSEINLSVLGITIANGEEMTIAIQNYSLAGNENSMAELTPFINSGDIVVSDGNIDLSPLGGIALLEGVLETVGQPVEFSPPVGANAPEAVPLNGATYGLKFIVGTELYGFTHLDNVIPTEDIVLQLHLAIDNSQSDRWVQFEITILTTTGIGDKALNTHDAVINTDQVEVPTTPFLIFDLKTILPSNLFENEEDNIFFKVRRITASGKTAPTNDPVVVRVDKEYKRRKA